MTASRYYRGGATATLWGVVIALALALALWFAGRATVATIDATARVEERAKVLAEGAALRDASLALAYRRWTVERDSLRALAALRDTVLVSRLRVVHDTTWLPADTTPTVRLFACRMQLDSLATACEAFRVTATRALAVADSQRTADTAITSALSVQLAAIRRADAEKAGKLASRNRWRTIERGVCGGALAFGIFTVFKPE